MPVSDLCKLLAKNDRLVGVDLDAIMRWEPGRGRLGLVRQRSRARAALNLFAVPLFALVTLFALLVAR